MSANVIDFLSAREAIVTSIAYVRRQFRFDSPPAPHELIERWRNVLPAHHALIAGRIYAAEDEEFIFTAHNAPCRLFVQTGVDRDTILAMLHSWSAPLTHYADTVGTDSPEYQALLRSHSGSPAR